MERIDTHSHVIPEVWRQWCEQHGHSKPDGMAAIPAWSAEDHIALMERNRITKSVLSISSPGTHLKVSDHTLARQITRKTNEAVAEICRKYPDKFDFFASLPLPDVEGSLQEIDYALNDLGAKGFALLTNSHGYYLGDSKFDAVFKKLNDRHAVVFIHPTDCCTPDRPNGPKPLDSYPGPMMEFFFDTTRAVVNLLLSGTVSKFPNITYLVSHCGASLPPLLQRFTCFFNIFNSNGGPTADEVKELFRTRFYFDLAGLPFPDLIQGYLMIAGPDRLLYGSDTPYTPRTAVDGLADIMDKSFGEMFDEDMIKKIYSGNAKTLLNL